jgi:zinc D-Ala-D-Ala carboxypeptidase
VPGREALTIGRVMTPRGLVLGILLMTLAAGACSPSPTPEASPSQSASPTQSTPSPDVVAPAIVGRLPGPGAVMGTHDAIWVAFSEAVSGIDAARFQLRDQAGSLLPAQVAYDPATQSATLTPLSPLTVVSRYEVTLAGAILDPAGNHLAAESWTVATSGHVSFGSGTYTGYRFEGAPGVFDAIRRITLGGPSGATAIGYQTIGGQGYLQISAGSLTGFWVHGTPGGLAQDDRGAPITPLPACTYLDLPTARPGLDAWATTVLDTLYALPASYVPPDLVDTGQAGLNGGHLIRSLALADLTAMVAAAEADGARLAVQSSYRSYGSQVLTFNGWVRQVGLDAALSISARPGHSEHQLGTAIDFRSVSGPSPWNIPDWAVTAEGAWMSANAWRYGWILSYPRGSSEVSCYGYEPWHFRYVGREIARSIHDSATTERQWLWAQGYGVR